MSHKNIELLSKNAIPKSLIKKNWQRPITIAHHQKCGHSQFFACNIELISSDQMSFWLCSYKLISIINVSADLNLKRNNFSVLSERQRFAKIIWAEKFPSVLCLIYKNASSIQNIGNYLQHGKMAGRIYAHAWRSCKQIRHRRVTAFVCDFPSWKKIPNNIIHKRHMF